MTKPGNGCSKLQKKTKKKQEVTVSLAAAKETNVDAAIPALSPELDAIFTFREQRLAVKAFLGGKDVSALLVSGFGKSDIKHHGALRLATGQ